MKTSSYPEITDELLSAYIDNAVSDVERARVEQAVHEDTTVAWRLATLRETVNLLRTMPVLPAPRAFTLTAEQLGHPVRTPALVPGVIATDTRSAPAMRPAKPSPQPGRWTALLERWRGFWQAGSPVWRNAMAASMALLLVMVVAPAFLDNRSHSEQMAAAPLAMVREVAPAAESPTSPEQGLLLQKEAPAGSSESAEFSAPEIASAEEVNAPAEQAAVLEERVEIQPEAMPTVLGAAPVTDEPIIAAAALEQPADTAAARIASPSVREEDPLNPQPPIAESAEAGYGVAGAEMMPLAPASDLTLPSPSGDLAGLAEESAVQSMRVPVEVEQPAVDMTAPAEPTAFPATESPATESPATESLATESLAAESLATDSDGIVPAPMSEVADAPEADSASETVQAVEPTVVALADGAVDRPAETRTEADVPPVRDVGAIGLTQLLPWLQLALLGAVAVFGLLWLRSRRTA